MPGSFALSAKIRSTVAQELLVGITGICLVGFVLAHLAGNLLLFAGPEAFNGYAEKLASLGALLWVLRFGLLTAFILHVTLAAKLARANRQARAQRYEVYAYAGRKNLATRSMIYTGLTILLFLLLHLWDFTFGPRTGKITVVPMFGDAESLGLFGLVWNSFANPIHAILYIIAVSVVGLHLSHAISSVLVTLGILPDAATRHAEIAAKAIGILVAVGFASIPLYVLVRSHLFGA